MTIEKVVEQLKKPLPPEAVSQHPTKPYLSTIKAIYVVERLNEVFGLGGWEVTSELVTSEKFLVGQKQKIMIVVKSKFHAKELDINVESYGGNDNEDLGDAYKGACTDALTKIGSYLYVGMDVFKGLGSEPVDAKNVKQKVTLPEGLKTNLQSLAQAQSANPLCNCGEVSKKVQTKKPGANQGRYFFACAKPQANQCDMFLWEDQLIDNDGFEPNDHIDEQNE